MIPHPHPHFVLKSLLTLSSALVAVGLWAGLIQSAKAAEMTGKNSTELSALSVKGKSWVKDDGARKWMDGIRAGRESA